MIVDSSALLEQATDDIVRSAFDSAGQRCSALRVLCIQDDVYDDLLEMIKGNMRELKIGNPVGGVAAEANERGAARRHNVPLVRGGVPRLRNRT